MGVWGAVAGSGGAAGVLLGGMLTEWAGWEWVLYVNVPIGIAAALLAPRLLPESRNEGARHFDVAGAVTVTAGLSLLVYSLVNANSAGWGSAETLVLVGVALAADRAFVIIELQHARAAGPVPGHLPRPLDPRHQHRRAADRDVAVLDVLLHLALHAAGAGLRRAQDRLRLPAAGGRDHRLRRHRLDAGHAPGRQAGADRRPGADRDRPAVVLADLGRRQLRRRRPVPVDHLLARARVRVRADDDRRGGGRRASTRRASRPA